MKILHCCLAAAYHDNHSYQENILPKMHKLQGFEVKILTSTLTYLNNGNVGFVSPSSYFNENNIEVTRLPFKKVLPNYLLKKLRIYSGVLHFLEDYRPDIIFIHDCQFLNVIDFKNFLKKNKEVKVFADCHTDFINSARNWISKNILHKIIYKKYVKLIEPYILNFYGTSPLRCDFLNKVYGVPKEKIQLLCLGVDDSNFDIKKKDQINYSFRKKYRISNDDFLIVTGGRIDERKKIHFLLEAFSKLKMNNISLIVFGTPDQEMVNVIKPYSELDNIIFTGWMDSNQINEILLSADLAIYPGTHSVLWEQSIGLGLPCIFKRWNGIEHVDVGGNCLFIEDSEIKTIIAVLKQVTKNKKLYESLKTNSLRKGPSNFSYSEIAKKSISF